MQQFKFKTYNGPEVTRVIVNKGSREMFLLHNETVLKAYKVDLGFAPRGHKVEEGDGRTPEGEYVIDRRNPNSSFYLSIGISYPNERGIARAAIFLSMAGRHNLLGLLGRIGQRAAYPSPMMRLRMFTQW
ncbi:ErfK/YbiS/YcfS/YnhG family protein [hydrothermal vent metagenome]|uniref:ErfK/YbiS/YcfS/YnhG family protein n=1 Tax=hydrothermal vent metagenome TaxID=652676 RepID=A0A3B0RXC8_9ZZZZ